MFQDPSCRGGGGGGGMEEGGLKPKIAKKFLQMNDAKKQNKKNHKYE